MCMSAMVQLEIPHLNLMSKMDLVPAEFRDTDFDKCVIISKTH